MQSLHISCTNIYFDFGFDRELSGFPPLLIPLLLAHKLYNAESISAICVVSLFNLFSSKVVYLGAASFDRLFISFYTSLFICHHDLLLVLLSFPIRWRLRGEGVFNNRLCIRVVYFVQLRRPLIAFNCSSRRSPKFSLVTCCLL